MLRLSKVKSMLPQHMAPARINPEWKHTEAAGNGVCSFRTLLKCAAIALQGQGGLAASAASTSNASQPLHLNPARVEPSATATEARGSRKSGKTSLFRRLVPRCLESCLPPAPAPAAKAPSPEVGSPNICCLAARQHCAPLWDGTVAAKAESVPVCLWDSTVATMAKSVPLWTWR